MMPQRILLDTDIGDDVDDALALAFALASPELELAAVTTVWGNTLARSQQARTLLALAGGQHIAVPVAAGCGAVLADRPPSHGGCADYLSGALPNQHACALPEGQIPLQDGRHAVDLILSVVRERPGEVIPVTIGGMTNLAVALTKEPRAAAQIPKIISMAGGFGTGAAEWNIRCDPAAAAIVLHSGILVDLVPFDTTSRVQLTELETQRILEAAGPVARNLACAVALWAEAHPDWGAGRPTLHDPLAVLAAFQPDLFVWRRGVVCVDIQGSATYAFTTFVEDEAGPHRVAVEVDRAAAVEMFLDRVVSL